jgi:hypothetical protein
VVGRRAAAPGLEVVDHLIEEDLQQAAVGITSLVCRTTMRAVRMPRPPLPEMRR